MDIGIPIKDWGAVDATNLREAILAQDDLAWNEDEQRQEDYDVHRQTKSIVMLFVFVPGKIVLAQDSLAQGCCVHLTPVFDRYSNIHLCPCCSRGPQAVDSHSQATNVVGPIMAQVLLFFLAFLVLPFSVLSGL